jgi:hypothetical protein
MKPLKPIETRYRGYRFRSRLEARWAVFFDDLGIPFEYELEGYSLPSGAAYLPDFVLPNLRVYVEVKPTEKLAISELKKIVEFALAGDHQLLLIVGSPTQETMYIIDRRTCGSVEEIEGVFENPLPDDEVVEIFFDNLRDWGTVQIGVTPQSHEWTLLFKTMPPSDESKLKQALLRAKQSRFEFGEEG